jgi:hypothetical protein
MAVITDTTDIRYWKVVGADDNENGTFTVHLVEVKDAQGTPMDVQPPARFDIIRNNDPPRRTIIKITVTTQVNRTIDINPAS